MNRSPAVTTIILINIGVYLLWMFFGDYGPSFMTRNFLTSWVHLMNGRVWTLLTSEFSHNMLLHIFLNMFVLSSFGPVMETLLGIRSFLTLYLVGGLVASVSHCLVSNYLLGAPDLPVLGASGAISGIIIAFALMFPRQKILLFGFIPIPAIAGGVLFVALDVWGLVAQAEGGGLPIGHGAHLGGALTGIVYYYFWIRPRARNYDFVVRP